MERPVVIFHEQCRGKFWDRVREEITDNEDYEVFRGNLGATPSPSGRNHIIIFGFSGKDPNQIEVSDVLKSIREAKKVLKDEVKILAVIPKNGDFQELVFQTGADDTINTKEADMRGSTVLKERINNFIHSYKNDGELTEAIFCQGDNAIDPAVKLARSIETMDSFAGEMLEKPDGSREEIRRYALHMRRTGHEDARNSVMSQLRPFIGRRILDAGCGEGHPHRMIIRNIVFPAIEGNERDSTFLIGVDRLEKMIIWARKGFENLQRENIEDHRKGDLSRVIIPNLVDAYFIQKDFFDVTPEELRHIRMSSSGTEFGSVDTIVLQYVAQWTPDKMDIVRWAGGMLPRGGKVVLLEEHPLKVTPSIFINAEMAQNIDKYTWKFETGVKEYFRLWEDGFKKVSRIADARINDASTPEKDAHYAFGVVMEKR